MTRSPDLDAPPAAASTTAAPDHPHPHEHAPAARGMAGGAGAPGAAEKPQAHQVSRWQLDNGLTILALPMHDAPVVAVQAWVDVGSADEDDTISGIAHLHEHMLFKGTAKRGVGEIARTVEASGGEINAWTSFDQTVYHVVMAAHELELGLDLLADAVQNSAFDPDELARESEVVVEEIRRAEDAPSRRLSRALFQTAFTTHPYRRPILGTEASVRSFTRQRIVQFYQTHYRPERITLVVTGDYQPGELRRLVDDTWGAWHPAGKSPVRQRATEPGQTEARVQLLREDVRQSRLALAWHIPGLHHRDVAALDALSVVLGYGDASVLVNGLRQQEQLVDDCYATTYTPRDPGVFTIGAGLKPGQHAAAFQRLLGYLEEVRQGSIDEATLERARVSILSDAAYQRETVQGMARKLGFFQVVAGDYAFEERYLQAVQNLTPDDLQRVARRYLTATPSVVLQSPEGEALELSEAQILKLVAGNTAGAAAASAQASGAGASGANAAEGSSHPMATGTPASAPGASKAGAYGVHRHVCDNGAVLLVRPESGPVVSMRAVAMGGQRWETAQTQGIGLLLSSVWGIATEALDETALAQQVAGLGGYLGAFAGRNVLGMKGDFVAAHAHDGLRLFGDALVRCRIEGPAVERERAVLLQRIRQREDQPLGVAYDAFVQALYRGHPYGFRMTGTAETAAALTVEQLRAHRSRMAAPDKLVLSVAGPVDPEAVLAQLAQLAEAPPSPDLDAPVPMPELLAEPARVRRVLPKEQTHILVGGFGTTLDSPDRFPLEVLTAVLSGQGGRLFLELRDKQSLAYSVSCSSVQGLDPGPVYIHIGTSPDKVAQALAGIYEQLQILRDVAVGADELARAQRYLIGAQAIDMQRAGARAFLMALNERYALGYHDHLNYADRIREVTAADIQRVAQRYFAPSGLVEAVVGP